MFWEVCRILAMEEIYIGELFRIMSTYLSAHSEYSEYYP